MSKSIEIISVAILAFSLNNAWAADTNAADTSGSGMKGMDKDHMNQMHKHMDEMHKSKDKSDAMKGDGKCEMESDGKCDERDMRSMDKPAADKSKAPAKAADDHTAHH